MSKIDPNESQLRHDRHHKVSSLVKSHQNTHNSVKYIYHVINKVRGPYWENIGPRFCKKKRQRADILPIPNITRLKLFRRKPQMIRTAKIP